jgi:phosphonate transport system substrate-binding protein
MAPVARLSGWLAILLWGLAIATTCLAEDYMLAIQPVQSKQATLKAYQPLAQYLSEATGDHFKVVTELNFLTYWEHMRHKHDYDLVLDAAHFTDFRVKRQNYEVLVKIPDTVSYSLVTPGDVPLFDAQELIGKRVATAPSPSLGGVRLQQMFPNPLRQPTIVPTDNFQQALEKVRSGEINAALVPTPLIRGDNTVFTVTTTKPVPHMALSASPRVDENTQKLITTVLLDANQTPKGQAMLKAINFPAFVPADSKLYDGYASLLEGVWGY